MWKMPVQKEQKYWLSLLNKQFVTFFGAFGMVFPLSH